MEAALNKIEKHLIWLLPFVALILYWPTMQAGFVHDFTGWYERYQTHGWSGIPHCFGYHRLQHFMHFVHFLFYKLFDTTPFPWYFTYSVMFGVNSYLVYRLGRSLTSYFKANDISIPIVAALLYLIHPFHTTAVVWKVCFHYLMATFFMLSILLIMFHWLHRPTKKRLFAIYGCFILGLFTHELIVSIPLISLILLGFLLVDHHVHWRKFLIWILIPQFLILPLYFSLTPYLLLDTGKAPLLSEHNIDIVKQASGVYQYASKHVLFTRYWSHVAKEKWKQQLSEKPAIYVISSIILLLILLFFYYYRKIPPKIKLFAFCCLAFAAAIAPFSSAYISYILYIENDMYGFSASAFIIIGLVALIKYISSRISNVLLLLYGLLSIVFLTKSIYYWHESGHIMNSLLDDFRWYDKDKVYVLTSPDNFKGALMTKSPVTSMLDDHLFVKNKEYPKCEIEDIYQFNMTNSSNSTSVVVHTSDSLSVKLDQWGTWYWRRGYGAYSYEDDKFKVELSVPFFRFKRKIKEENAVFIYQSGDKWKEVEGW